MYAAADPAAVAALATAIPSAEGPIAQALVGKLARVTPDAATLGVWAQGFVTALGHADTDTRAAAWDVLLTGEKSLKKEIGDAVAAAEAPVVYEAIVAGATEELARAEVADKPTGTIEGLTIVPSKLPHSTARPNTFALLNAALRGKAAGDGQAGVDLIFENATQEAVAALANVSLRVQGTTIQRLGKTSNPELKVPVIKTLLVAPDPTLVQPLLKAAAGTPIPIEDARDPFITAPLRVEDPVARTLLLTALARAQLGPVFESSEMQQVLTTAAGPESDARTQLAAVELVARHWQPEGSLPAPGMLAGRRGGRGGRGRGAKGDTVLDRLIRSPDTAPNVAVVAASILVVKGFAGPAAEATMSLEAVERQAEIVKGVGLGAAPIGPRAGAYLAAFAGSEEAAVAEAAQAAIDKLLQATPSAERWRLASEFKLHLDCEGVVRAGLEGDEESAELISRVLAAAASLDAAEAAGLAAATGEEDRNAYLEEIAYTRAEKPVGDYRVVMYADVQGPPDAQGTAGAARGGKRGANVRYDVPLDLGSVRVVGAGEDAFEMIVGQQKVGLKVQSSRSGRRGMSIRATMELDAKPLIALALGRLAAAPKAGSGGLLGKLGSLIGGGADEKSAPGPVPVPAAVLAELKLPAAKLNYVIFGRWQGEMSFRNTQSNAALPSWPFQKARIVLERVKGPAAK